MTTINSIARTETEENLNNAVEILNIEKVQDLLNRFEFNEDFLKDLSIHIIQKNTLDNTNFDIAMLLLKNTSKRVKEETIAVLKSQAHLNWALELEERLDL